MISAKWPILLMCVLFLCSLSTKEVRAGTDIFTDDNSELEDQYSKAHALLSPSSSIREYRRALKLLEATAQAGKGRASADALADLAHVYLFGSSDKKIVTTQQPGRAFVLANQSSSLGSPKGMHVLSFLYKHGFGVGRDVDRALELEKRAAEQHNYLPSMMSYAFHLKYLEQDCEAALRIYRIAANVAVGKMEANNLGDYGSLRALSAELDELGDDNHARAARNTETVRYWKFHADRREESELKPRAYYELGRMHQLGLHGAIQNLPQALEYYDKAAALGHVGALGELGRLQSIGHGCELDMVSTSGL